jgi:hypothetical protein
MVDSGNGKRRGPSITNPLPYGSPNPPARAEARGMKFFIGWKDEEWTAASEDLLAVTHGRDRMKARTRVARVNLIRSPSPRHGESRVRETD